MINGKWSKQWISALLLLIIFSLIQTNTVLGENKEFKYRLETLDDVLPYNFSRGSAVWVEEQKSIYIFGGRNETAILDRIMKYYPNTTKIEFLSTRLPTVLMGTTAVSTGNHVFVFGGKDLQNFYKSILRFDPNTNTIINMSAELPKPTVGAAAVWNGEYIYFFGGCWGGVEHEKFNTILRYDPIRDNITIMQATLPYGRSGLAATYDGENIYVLGGSDGIQYSKEIYIYTPENDTLWSLPGQLPSGRKHIQAEYYNGWIYIFGGRGSPMLAFSDIVKYNITDHTSIKLSESLNQPCEFRMHAFDGENIYLIGGFYQERDINQFIKFSVEGEEEQPSSNDDSSCDVLWIIILVFIIVTIIALFIKSYKEK